MEYTANPLRKRVRAWCRHKYGALWYDSDKKARMDEALAALAYGEPLRVPDAVLFWDADGGFYVDYECEPPEWAEQLDGQFGGYHAIALPTPDQLLDDELTVTPGGRAYLHEDLLRDWDILRRAKTPADLEALTQVEWGQHTPEEFHEGVITAYGPFPALTQYVAFLQHAYDSHPGYAALWRDEVPSDLRPGDTVTLADGRTAVLLDTALLDAMKPRVNAMLPERLDYAACVQ